MTLKLEDLEQLSAMKSEIAVLKERLNKIHNNAKQYVADTVKDYSKGYERIITICGYTILDAEKSEKIIALLQKRRAKLDEKILAAEEFVSSITDSRIRTLISLHYIEGKNWKVVANKVYGSPCEDRARKAALRASSFVALIAIWHFASSMRTNPALPQPFVVIQITWELIQTGTYTEHILASLEIILLGIAIAVFFGFFLGVLMFQYESCRLAILPLIESVRGVAALTLFPLLIVLFGIGTFSRAFVIFWTAWPAVVLSTMNGLKVDEHIVDAARTCGAGEWRIIRSIRIPMALPGIITGVRIGVSGGWIGLVAAEMLGATRGLGFFLLWSAQSFVFDRVYATIIIIAAIGGIMNFSLLFIQKLLLRKYGG